MSFPAEIILFGGAVNDDAASNPRDITIQGNYFTKPMSWRGQDYFVKNLFEIKNALRVLLEGNIFENHWAEQQSGSAFVMTVRSEGKWGWGVFYVSRRLSCTFLSPGRLSLVGSLCISLFLCLVSISRFCQLALYLSLYLALSLSLSVSLFVSLSLSLLTSSSDGAIPWAVLQDVTFRYNVLRHSCGGVSQSSADGGTSTGTQQNSAAPTRVLWEHNIFYDIDNPVRERVILHSALVVL